MWTSAVRLPHATCAALATIFGTTPDVVDAVRIVEHSRFARLHGSRVVATTRRGVIHLAGSRLRFLVDRELVLHEYFHVLEQWNVGRLTTWRYVSESIRRGYRGNRYEIEGLLVRPSSLPGIRGVPAGRRLAGFERHGCAGLGHSRMNPRAVARRAARTAALLASLAAGPLAARAPDRSHCVEPGVVGPPVKGVEIGGPEVATGFANRGVAHGATLMAVTANPVASRVACDILIRGGSAVDAAVAAQMVLNLVEPQSSGLGGGAFLIHYDAARGTVETYDGRETAPAAATGNYLRYVDDETDRTTPRPSIRASGRSIGVPGVLRMLELAHREHGRLSWATLFQPAIAIANDGFRISPRMNASIASQKSRIARDPGGAAYFLDAAGDAKQVGTLLRNPALARTFTTIARDGADAFYRGGLAAAIVAKVAESDGVTPGRMTLADLAGYRAQHREPVCTPYRAYEVCGVGPPSSGGIAVAATLGILAHFDLSAYPPKALDRDGGVPSPVAVHLVAEAERLAYADRDRYVADTDFVPLPGGSAHALLDAAYLRTRAARIRLDRSMGRAEAGVFDGTPVGVDGTREHGTTNLTIADRAGNVVAMTTTIESGFGSFHFVGGFELNNQLTDFSIDPADSEGRPIANRVEGNKRPRSAMAPTLVFRTRSPDDASGREHGDFVLATGSAGGFVIIQYVVKSLVAALDWGLDPQQAVAMIDFGAANSPVTYVGGEHPDVDASDSGAHDPLVLSLRALGHTVSVRPQSSGLTMLRRTVVDGRSVWSGGADPRREGAAVGDAVGDALGIRSHR